MLSRYTKRLFINFDPDAAGANAAEKSIALLTEEDFEVKVVTLEAGLDPDRFIRERGIKEYVAAVKAAKRHSDYLIDRAMQLFPSDGRGQEQGPQLPAAAYPAHAQSHRARRICLRCSAEARH